VANPKSGRARGLEQLRPADLYPFAGLFLASLCLVAGVALSVLKAAGEVVWDGAFLAVRLHLNTSAPGVVCFIVAVLIVYLTRSRIR
jgi:hypothetical protein